MLYSGRFDKKEKPSLLIPQPYGTQFHRFGLFCLRYFAPLSMTSLYGSLQERECEIVFELQRKGTISSEGSFFPINPSPIERGKSAVILRGK